MLKDGQQIGTYEIGKVLGSGGFATVYRARHTLLGSDHAIKVLSADFTGQRELRDRFLAEGKILARLRHPNIVRVTDVLVEPGVAGLVMDFVEGETLEQALERHKRPMSLGAIRKVMLPVLHAVAHAHENGVIHRDLKPANIILGRGSGGAVHPIVVDFGIAKLAEGGKHTRVGITRTDTRLGTAGYMSPEQVRSAKDVDERTDIFSLGCILFEMATGQVAFRGDSEFDVMRAIVDGDIRLTLLHEPMRALVAHCVSSQPARRPTCRALGNDLAVLDDRMPGGTRASGADDLVLPQPESEPVGSVNPVRSRDRPSRHQLVAFADPESHESAVSVARFGSLRIMGGEVIAPDQAVALADFAYGRVESKDRAGLVRFLLRLMVVFSCLVGLLPSLVIGLTGNPDRGIVWLLFPVVVLVVGLGAVQKGAPTQPLTKLVLVRRDGPALTSVVKEGSPRDAHAFIAAAGLPNRTSNGALERLAAVFVAVGMVVLATYFCIGG